MNNLFSPLKNEIKDIPLFASHKILEYFVCNNIL